MSIEYVYGSTLVDTLLAKNLLNGLEQLYPEFEYWYTNKAMPDILLGNTKLILAKDNGIVVGVGIGKKDEEETKLRCIRVAPEYKNKGIGIRLIERSLRLLDCDKPVCTVAEEMMHDFSRAFVNEFQFDLTRVEKGLYRRGKLEYVFNKH